MAQNRIFRVGPVAMVLTTPTDILNPNITSTAGPVGITSFPDPYFIIRHIHIANRTGSNVSFSLYIGATGGSASGTELWKDYLMAANSDFDRYGAWRLDAADFLTGHATVASAAIITLSVEAGIAG